MGLKHLKRRNIIVCLTDSTRDQYTLPRQKPPLTAVLYLTVTAEISKCMLGDVISISALQIALWKTFVRKRVILRGTKNCIFGNFQLFAVIQGRLPNNAQ